MCWCEKTENKSLHSGSVARSRECTATDLPGARCCIRMILIMSKKRETCISRVITKPLKGICHEKRVILDTSVKKKSPENKKRVYCAYVRKYMFKKTKKTRTCGHVILNGVL